MKTPSPFTSTSATKTKEKKNHTKQNNKISRKIVKTKKKFKNITSHRPLILVPQNKQSIYISLSHVRSHIFFHNMATDDVNKTTHIYSSKSSSQLNLHHKPQRIYTQRNIQTDEQKSQNMSHKSPGHGNKSKNIINNLAL